MTPIIMRHINAFIFTVVLLASLAALAAAADTNLVVFNAEIKPS